MPPSAVPGYAGYRFPAEIISHAVWLYFRFPLSLRMVDELLAARRGLPPQEIAQAALAACRDWTEGELTDDFAVVVVKRSLHSKDATA